MEITVTFEQQIAELKAELALRQNVFRKWVIAGRMKKEEADRKYCAMRAALHTLIEIQERREEGRALQAITPGLDKLARDRSEEGLWR